VDYCYVIYRSRFERVCGVPVLGSG
jgi:hypothetical protein